MPGCRLNPHLLMTKTVNKCEVREMKTFSFEHGKVHAFGTGTLNTAGPAES